MRIRSCSGFQIQRLPNPLRLRRHCANRNIPLRLRRHRLIWTFPKRAHWLWRFENTADMFMIATVPVTVRYIAFGKWLGRKALGWARTGQVTFGLRCWSECSWCSYVRCMPQDEAYNQTPAITQESANQEREEQRGKFGACFSLSCLCGFDLSLTVLSRWYVQCIWFVLPFT